MLSRLTLDQLRVLVTIEETGSFSAAGRRLRRVQSAISHAIHALEDSQQVQLFDRTRRTPSLTPAGRVLAAHARHVLHHAELLERTAGAIAAGLEPELSLAVDSFVPTGPMIQSLAELQGQYPNLAVALFTEGLGSAERRVRNGTAALGICALLPGTGQDLQSYPLTDITLIPVVAPNHPLAREPGPLTREVLSEHVQLILTDPQQLPGPSFSVVSPRVWRFVDIARRLEFMLAGCGWGTMPLHLVEHHLAAGTLVRLAISDAGVYSGAIPLYAIHDPKRTLGMGAQWLLAALQRQKWL